MNRGQTEQVGSPRAIYDHPASRFVAGFLGKNNLLRAVVLWGPDGRPQIQWNGTRLGAAPRPALLAAGPCVLAIRPESITITEAVSGQPNAEDRIRGKVVSQTFLGASVDVLVAVGKDTLTVTVAGTASPVTPGEDVWLSFDAERLWSLPNGDIVLPEASALSRELAA
ncbi:TOBE domain-containing protein [Bradyrhizobium glycinis]|uniref:TOBE domain-containing protein n=1 Tax=Bradyrhizobium glycinis TaxID=2751812 RepID=UPI001FEB11CA|nr:TOBE domain-containing protein [Bradyrhizobium glycinis]